MGLRIVTFVPPEPVFEGRGDPVNARPIRPPVTQSRDPPLTKGYHRYQSEHLPQKGYAD